MKRNTNTAVTKKDIDDLQNAIGVLVKDLRVDMKKFATKDDLKKFATKDDLKKFATKDDLKRFATKDDLKRFATKDDLKNELRRYPTKEDLRMELRQYATKDDLDVMRKEIKSEFKQYATKAEMDKIIVQLIDKMVELDEITRNEIRKDIEGFKDEIVRVFANRFENHEKRICSLESCSAI
jgi:hypothetical protein